MGLRELVSHALKCSVVPCAVQCSLTGQIYCLDWRRQNEVKEKKH